MDPEGILKAWTTNERMTKARINAIIKACAYSLKVSDHLEPMDYLYPAHAGGYSLSFCKAAKKASWGSSMLPIFFIRRLPSFCFSKSLRLRVMSPP